VIYSEELGTYLPVWEELGELIKEAVPSLERRCFNPPNPQDPECDGLSGALISQNYDSLLKDLRIIKDFVEIARNILVAGEKAQNLCAKAGFDKHIFKLINVCVKVAARGYDGEPGHNDQKLFDGVVEACKTHPLLSIFLYTVE
jgi:palmitoyltransferase